jgi:plastocyanin
VSDQAPEGRAPVSERAPERDVAGRDEADEARQPRPTLPPVAYPLLGLVFGGILVFSFSRILLAVSKTSAAAIALLMALNILIGAGLVAYGSRVRRRPVSFPLLVIGGLALIAVGVAAAGLEGEPAEEPGPGGGPGAVEIRLVAKDIAFDRQEMSFPAGAQVTIILDNQDAGIQHNVAIWPEEDPSNVIFDGEIITGVASINYPPFTAPEQPGTYSFFCRVHPTDMRGTVTVSPAGEPGPGGGGGGEAPTVVAKNFAFQPTDVTVAGGGQVTVRFDNQDAGTPHNMQVFDGPDASAPSLFDGEVVTGPASADYVFEAPPPGKYFFHCKIHPTQMTGTLTVT